MWPLCEDTKTLTRDQKSDTPRPQNEAGPAEPTDRPGDTVRPSGVSPAMPSAEHHADIFRHIRDAHQRELAEDYVELIADLIDETGEARLVDVAHRLGVTKAAASTTIARLKRDDLVIAERYRSLRLTGQGRALAEECKRRHDIVYRFLRALGVSEATAYIDSEGMEHHISAETLALMKAFLKQR
ncbi:MAG: manganese-binding transcriptional regulator MntR [Pseudomonadota bacterium]